MVVQKTIQIMLGGDFENFEKYGLIVDTPSAIDIESQISKFALESAR